MTVDQLVREFGDCVSAQSKCIERGDANAGNDYAQRYIKAFEKLRSHGDAGRDALAILMDDTRPDVRVMSASFLLRYSEEKAKAVLQQEASKSGLIAFGAQQALERWQDGTWALDPA
ncbi:MAG: hypothetical protein OXU20_22460 [Myxococcales bacterium]|nr:hypothetical protein [Myxococcales bacterium]